MIVKVQLALAVTGGMDCVLIYNEDRSYCQEFDDVESVGVCKHRLGRRKKAYFYGYPRGDGGMALSAAAPAKNW